MPRVRMLTNVAGRNFEWRVDDVVDMSPEDAAVWADGERGELVTSVPPDTPERGRPRMETRVAGPATGKRGPGRPRKHL